MTSLRGCCDVITVDDDATCGLDDVMIRFDDVSTSTIRQSGDCDVVDDDVIIVVVGLILFL